MRFKGSDFDGTLRRTQEGMKSETWKCPGKSSRKKVLSSSSVWKIEHVFSLNSLPGKFVEEFVEVFSGPNFFRICNCSFRTFVGTNRLTRSLLCRSRSVTEPLSCWSRFASTSLVTSPRTPSYSVQPVAKVLWRAFAGGWQAG
jgi:hypothetical protein